MPAGRRSLLLQDDGKLLVGAWQGGGEPQASPPLVVRFDDFGSVDTTFGTSGIVSAGHTLAAAPDGTIVAADVESLGESFDSVIVSRILLDDAALASLLPRAIAAPRTTSQVLTVTYRDDDGIDTSTLDNRDIRVNGPAGFDLGTI